MCCEKHNVSTKLSEAKLLLHALMAVLKEVVSPTCLLSTKECLGYGAAAAIFFAEDAF